MLYALYYIILTANFSSFAHHYHSKRWHFFSAFGSTRLIILLMNTPIEILDEPLPFDREAWIGKGKNVPDNPLGLDQSVIDYCETLLKIPPAIIQHSFPSNKACVKVFTTHTLPKPTSSLAIIQPAHCFHPQEPNDDGL